MIVPFLIAAILIAVFLPWIRSEEIIGGDWPYVYAAYFQNIDPLPTAWSSLHGNGLGGVNPSFFLSYYYQFTLFLTSIVPASYPVIYKLFWFFPSVVLSFAGAYFLARSLSIQQPYSYIAGLIYTTNTYVLMVYGGGQMGIAFAYAFVPFVLYSFVRWMSESGSFTLSFRSITFILLYSVLLMFDPRIGYVVSVALLILTIRFYTRLVAEPLKSVFVLCLSGIAVLLLSAFWWYPVLQFTGEFQSHVTYELSGDGVLFFFSVARFEDAISLLHPNWPENMFGVVGFFDPLFLVLPIVACTILLIPYKKARIHVTLLYFFIILLTGSFLAKGVHEPFGFIYAWLYGTVPGFSLFRDPTKWYMLIAVSYAVLIPYVLQNLHSFFVTKNYTKLPLISSTIFVIVWMILIRQAWMHDLTGTFTEKKVLPSYIHAAELLTDDTQYGRVLWVPKRHRYSFESSIHPAVEASALYEATSSAEIIAEISSDKSFELLQNLSIGYIAVSEDQAGDLYGEQGQFAQTNPVEIAESLRSITWLEEIPYDGLTMFTVPDSRGRIFTELENRVSYEKSSINRYVVHVTEASPYVGFSERFHKDWIISVNGSTFHGEESDSGLVVFDTPVSPGDTIFIFHRNTGTIYTGIAISLITLSGMILYTFHMNRYEKE